MRLLSATVAALAVTAVAPAALACGGMFCSTPQGPSPAEPVDQNAERIVFDVNGDAGTVTAHVEIQYTGPADRFSWILPVPNAPDVDDVEESSRDLIDAYDEPTRMDVQLPSPAPCPTASGGGGGGCASDSGGFSRSAPTGAERGAGGGDVTVHTTGTTENYEFVVLSGATVPDLVEWLEDNDYNVSDNMEPAMEPYNDAGKKFLAVKLQSGEDASAIEPLAVTYEGTQPMIPIRLTAVAAQPLMGILAIIVGEQPYRPTNGFDAVEPQPGDVLFDQQGRPFVPPSQTNYFQWVAREADEAGGRRFVREYVGPNPAAVGSETMGDVVSRYYTRMSPWHMTADPRFEAAPDLDETTATLDLSDRPTLWGCPEDYTIAEQRPAPCAFNYCGAGATCTVADGRVGCECPDGEVAMRITGPQGDRHVTCAPADNPLGVQDEDVERMGGEPCANVDCGAGQCEIRGGFPTCRCDPGAVACLEEEGVRCRTPSGSVARFGPGAGPESRGGRGRDGGRQRGGLPAWMLFVLAWGLLRLPRTLGRSG